MDKMKRLSETIRTLMEGEFSGYIKINFSQGSLGRIEKSEEFEITNIAAADTAMKQVCGEKDVQNALRDRKEMQIVLQWLLPVTVCVLTMAGCAATGTHQVLQAGHSPAAATERLIQPGDAASIHYLCRLQSGEVAASTDPFSDSLPKASIYEKREDTGPLAIPAIGSEDAKRIEAVEDVPIVQMRFFDAEIAYQLGKAIVGMKEGGKRTVELKAAEPISKNPGKYLASLNRVRIQPKNVVMPKHTYEYLTKHAPEVGQAYTHDPDFPGTVESISDQDVTIRISVTPGIKQTLFGPAMISEQGDNYKMDIDARKGALIRSADMVGRISDVDDKAFTIDFANAFGGQALMCDVSVEKIQDANLMTSESGTR
jgi:FKBP-type peptidyl-prolyl cis-trans isomerase 2